MSPTPKFDVLIVGAGPAGLTAAIYGTRANLKVCVVTNEPIGGKILKTLLIENFPSFPTGSGLELAKKFQAQAEYQKIFFLKNQITKITRQKSPFGFILSSADKSYQTRFLIVATGTKERKLTIPDVDRFLTKGVSYWCVVWCGFL